MRESPRGDRSVCGDHKEAMNVTVRSKMRFYPTQEAKSRRGTGVGHPEGRARRRNNEDPTRIHTGPQDTDIGLKEAYAE